MQPKILVVDDEQSLTLMIKKTLDKKGFAADAVHSGKEAVLAMEQGNYHLVILDYKMPGIDGLETLKRIKQLAPDVRVIFTTAFGDDELAMRSLEEGADDFMHKPFDLKNLLFRVNKTLQFHNLCTEVETLRSQVRPSKSSFIAQSPSMKRVLGNIDQVAQAHAPVLICGETGTGKELVAGAIHNNTYNPRKEKPFITVNSAAISENLIESELFGHARGAFTGAASLKHGLFEVADGGTLFLDEISSAPLSLQAKLLRVLDSGEFIRVGESRPRTVNVRVLAATNKDLPDEVRAGRFREDLYHRLNVLSITLPPLRRREGDIRVLVRHFLDFFNQNLAATKALNQEAEDALIAYTWPGNVRELKHCMESLVLVTAGDTITGQDLPDRIAGRGVEIQDGSFTDLKNKTIHAFERKYFSTLVKNASGNVARAARIADMNRAYLIKKLKEYDIDPKSFKK